jgi:hypothetical protein
MSMVSRALVRIQSKPASYIPDWMCSAHGQHHSVMSSQMEPPNVELLPSPSFDSSWKTGSSENSSLLLIKKLYLTSTGARELDM